MHFRPLTMRPPSLLPMPPSLRLPPPCRLPPLHFAAQEGINVLLKPYKSFHLALNYNDEDADFILSKAKETFDFTSDPFENILLFPQARRITLAIEWPNSYEEAQKSAPNMLWVHAMWQLPQHVLSVEQMIHLNKILVIGFNEALNQNSDLIMRYWQSTKQIGNFKSAKNQIVRSYKKHGKPAGLLAVLYLYYGLALRAALDDSFGLPVGVEMTLEEVAAQCSKQLANVVLFGEHIGESTYPLILTLRDSKIRTDIASKQPNEKEKREEKASHYIKQMKIDLVRSSDGGNAKWKVVELLEDKDRPIKYLGGELNSTRNKVVLPGNIL